MPASSMPLPEPLARQQGQGYTPCQVSPPTGLNGDSLQDPEALPKVPGSDSNDDVPMRGELDADDGSETDVMAALKTSPGFNLPPAANVTLRRHATWL
eukprot:jgi/Tetstr1/465536/TSEL_010205.t1